MTQLEKPYNEVFFAHQPVFDSAMEAWGYEIYYRETEGSERATFSDAFMATLEVLASFALCHDKSIKKARVIVNFSEKALLEKIPYSLPAELVVIQFPEPRYCSPDLLGVLTELKSCGYQLSVDDFTGREECQKLYEMASLVTVGVNSLQIGALESIKSMGRLALLGAKKIETQEQYEACRLDGFDLFQGYFFKRPEVKTVRKLSSSETIRLELLEKLNAKEIDFETLAQTIRLDASLSMRLLKLLNSPIYGLSKEVSSIQQALIYLGREKLTQWLRVILLTDMKYENKTIELHRLALFRAKFFENLVAERRDQDFSSSLFMLGLFSLLDVMLDVPMESVMAQLASINEEIQKAFRAEESSFYGWLELSRAMEDSNWEQVGAQAARLHLDSSLIMESYQGALAWSKSVLDSIDG